MLIEMGVDRKNFNKLVECSGVYLEAGRNKRRRSLINRSEISEIIRPNLLDPKSNRPAVKLSEEPALVAANLHEGGVALNI